MAIASIFPTRSQYLDDDQYAGVLNNQNINGAWEVTLEAGVVASDTVLRMTDGSLDTFYQWLSTGGGGTRTHIVVFDFGNVRKYINTNYYIVCIRAGATGGGANLRVYGSKDGTTYTQFSTTAIAASTTTPIDLAHTSKTYRHLKFELSEDTADTITVKFYQFNAVK